jgi:hypothetical protein
MAVTIDEMHVEVQEAAPSTPAATSSGEPKKDVNLRDALDILHERKLRLRAN